MLINFLKNDWKKYYFEIISGKKVYVISRQKFLCLTERNGI